MPERVFKHLEQLRSQLDEHGEPSKLWQVLESQGIITKPVREQLEMVDKMPMTTVERELLRLQTLLIEVLRKMKEHEQRLGVGQGTGEAGTGN